MDRNYVRDTEFLNLMVKGDIFMEFNTIRNAKIAIKNKPAGDKEADKEDKEMEGMKLPGT